MKWLPKQKTIDVGIGKKGKEISNGKYRESKRGKGRKYGRCVVKMHSGYMEVMAKKRSQSRRKNI